MSTERRVPDDHHADHTPEAIRKRLDEGPHVSYLGHMVYGAMDGTVTTFAIVCGMVGAQLSGGVVLVLGLASLIADGFSMAVGNFLGTRAEKQHRQATWHEELKHIEVFPEGERREIREIFARKGFTGTDLDNAVNVITSDVERWVETMVTEEHGLPPNEESEVRAARTTFLSFLAAGFVPLLPYAFNALGGALSDTATFTWAIALTSLAFFGIGALKSHSLDQSPWRGGFETLLFGSAAAVLAYYTAMFLRGLVVG